MTDPAVPLNLTDAQRRRANALVLAKRLYPYVDSEVAMKIATWIIRGNPSQRIPTVVSEQAAELERMYRRGIVEVKP